jgi:prophage maintenance system killer protein
VNRKPFLSRLLAVSFALVFLVQVPARGQDEWREKLAVVERLMSEEIPAEKKAELAKLWAAIAANAKQLREAESGTLDDPTKEKIGNLEAAEDVSRRAPSSTISSNRNEGAANWQRADQLVRDWVARGEAITLARIQEINKTLRQQAGTDAVYSGGRNSALAVPDAHTDEALEGFMKWFDEAQKTLDPIELAGRTYQRLVTLHPLQDANGRTSRMLMDWVLRRAGLPAVALDNQVATNAISDPFVFGGTAEAYSGRPLKVVENLTQNLERFVRAKLAAVGRSWSDAPEKTEGLPLPEHATDHAPTTGTTSQAESFPARVAGASPASIRALERPVSTGLVHVLGERVRESADEHALVEGAR